MSKKEEMYAHIAAWKTSSLTQKGYCELHSLKLPTFSYWVIKQRKEVQETEEGFFIPVQPIKKGDQQITVEYPNGVKVHLSDRELLQEAIHMY